LLVLQVKTEFTEKKYRNKIRALLSVSDEAGMRQVSVDLKMKMS
jgi:hypothetical protein